MTTMSAGLFLRTILVLFSALVLQSTVFAWFTIAGVHADLMLALAVGAGVAGGAQRGAVTGFAAGVIFDLLLFTPFGLSALTYSLVGYAVGLASAARVRQSRVFPVIVGLLGGAVGVLLFAVLGELVGQPLLSEPDLALIVAVEAVATAIFTVPAAAALRWAWRPAIDSGAVLI